MLEGQVLINLDSEAEGVFTIGCAGGRHTTLSLPLQRSAIPEAFTVYRIQAHGMSGGHSGVDIHTHRANANKIIGRTLDQISRRMAVRLVAVDGGTAHNAIPRRAAAVVACHAADAVRLETIVARFRETVRHEYAAVEPAIQLSVSSAPAGTFERLAVSEKDTRKIIRLILALPNGVAELSATLDGLVETSSNLARLETGPDRLDVLSSQRSLVMSRLDEITAEIEAVAGLAGATVASGDGYPAWLPNLDSALLAPGWNAALSGPNMPPWR